MELYYNKADEIDGWFNYKEIIPILESINKEQGNGNLLEIGLFKGKSFYSINIFLKTMKKRMELMFLKISNLIMIIQVKVIMIYL